MTDWWTNDDDRFCDPEEVYGDDGLSAEDREELEERLEIQRAHEGRY